MPAKKKKVRLIVLETILNQLCVRDCLTKSKPEAKVVDQDNGQHVKLKYLQNVTKQQVEVIRRRNNGGHLLNEKKRGGSSKKLELKSQRLQRLWLKAYIKVAQPE